MIGPRLSAVLSAAAVGVALGACGGTLYDPARVPASGAGITCTPPAHACGNACVPQTIAQCGPSCAACGAPANATATCASGPDGEYACGYACPAGLFACPAGCCRATQVFAGGNHSCAILSDTSLACWGSNDAGQLGVGPAGGFSQSPVLALDPGVTQAALGAHHTCAVQAGAVKCFGSNLDGQLGQTPVSAGDPTPVTVAGLTGVTRLAAGTAHTCAVAGGAVRCWGRNAQGQLGTGSASATPATDWVSSLVTTGASDVASLLDTTCALVAGQVSCWGANGTGQIGDPAAPNPQPTPDPVTLPSTATILAVGGDHSCAVVAGNGLWCWGANDRGQLGTGSTGATQTTPVQASRIDNNKLSIWAAPGASFTCSAKDAVQVTCNGANNQEQTGVAPASTSNTGNGPVAFGNGFVGGAAGLEHACALVDVAPPSSTLVVKCWGRNAEGQLGRATAPAGSPSASPDLVGP
jgi:hypothetical protein